MDKQARLAYWACNLRIIQGFLPTRVFCMTKCCVAGSLNCWYFYLWTWPFYTNNRTVEHEYKERVRRLKMHQAIGLAQICTPRVIRGHHRTSRRRVKPGPMLMTQERSVAFYWVYAVESQLSLEPILTLCANLPKQELLALRHQAIAKYKYIKGHSTLGTQQNSGKDLQSQSFVFKLHIVK